MKSSRRQALGAMAGLSGTVLPQGVRAGGMQLPIRLVVLDVGGTIVEERGDFSGRIIDSYRTVKGIPGAEDAFRAMQKMGLTLATSTGFDEPITSSIMTRLGWKQYFVAQITSDDVVHGRPSPYMLFHAMEAARVDSVSQVIAVGDTPLDLQAGANGGVRGVVGVLSGAGTRKTMEQHTDLIDSVAALPVLLHSKYGMS